MFCIPSSVGQCGCRLWLPSSLFVRILCGELQQRPACSPDCVPPACGKAAWSQDRLRSFLQAAARRFEYYSKTLSVKRLAPDVTAPGAVEARDSPEKTKIASR